MKFTLVFSLQLLAAGLVIETPTDIDFCKKDSDCIIVPHNHCCGTTKKAINSKYLGTYMKNPAWQKTEGGFCANMGVCPSDADVTSAYCGMMGNKKRCLKGPPSKK